LIRIAVIALAAICLLGVAAEQALATSKPGVVTKKNGERVVGDVDEQAVAGAVVITDAAGHKIQLFLPNVQSVHYFANTREEYDARLANLGTKDVAGRVALARWALVKNEVDLALAAAASAKAIDPANPEVAAVERQISIIRPPPPVATAPVNPSPATAAVAKTGPANRMLTADEIQLVRMRELPENDRSIKLSIPASAKQAALDAGIIQKEELRNIPLQEVAMRILKDRDSPPALRKQIKLVGDPAPITEFRQRINKPLLTGCATAACHGDKTTTAFRLFSPPDREEASLTNFVILQKYEKQVDGVQRSMLNRTQPQASLLLGYMLPAEISRVPHPEVAAYKGAVKTTQDVNFLAVGEWMGKSLIPVPPSYDDIDLTTAPAAPKAGDVPPAKPEPRKPGTPAKKGPGV
jgi:hypothetical protein